MYPPRGFTLVIALVLSAVVLAVGMALTDIAVKQLQLSSSAKNSQIAFYNADSALECALYYDQKVNAFYYNESQNISIVCNGLTLSSYASLSNYAETQNGSARTTTFSIPCADSSGVTANITIIKTPTGTTNIYANGYNTCRATDSNRIERGLKIQY